MPCRLISQGRKLMRILTALALLPELMTRILLLLLLAMPLPAGAQVTLPTLPQASVEGIAYSLPSGGTTHNPTNSSQFQTALNTAALGDVIVLQAGTTYTGPFTLPNKGAGTNWIYVISSALASLPAAGNRVSPSAAANMPKVVVAVTGGGASIFNTVNGTHHYRFVGIEFRPVETSGGGTNSMIQIGNGESVSANLPHHIIFDRCYIHGNGTNVVRGLALNGDHLAAINNHISDFHAQGADTQAVWVYNSRGPILVQNNYLHATGENMMVGGSQPAVEAHLPADITVKTNHFFKTPSWLNASNPYTTKNLFELKLGRRVLVEGNRFENIGWEEQNGFAVQLTPRNEFGTAPWSTVEDVTFRYNAFLRVGSGFNVAGEDGNEASQMLRRLLIEHNIVFMHDWPLGDLLRFIQTTNPSGSGPQDVTVRHNTVVGGDDIPSFFIFSEFIGSDAQRWNVRDNISQSNNATVSGRSGAGSASINNDFVSMTFTKNAMIGEGGTYPAGNFFPATPAAVQFVNFALGNFTLGNYKLLSSSPFKAGNANQASDGKDLGADIDAIEAALAGGNPATIQPPANLRVR